jgi:hypothetical protein
MFGIGGFRYTMLHGEGENASEHANRPGRGTCQPLTLEVGAISYGVTSGFTRALQNLRLNESLPLRPFSSGSRLGCEEIRSRRTTMTSRPVERIMAAFFRDALISTANLPIHSTRTHEGPSCAE